MKDTIIILSHEDDTVSHDILKMAQEQSPAFILDTGDFPTRVQLDAECADGTWRGYLTTKDNERIDLARIKSIMYRRPSHYRADETLPQQLQTWAENESDRGFGGILRSLDCFWMSDIDAIRAASYKPRQLVLAHRLGFQVPATCITNDPATLRDFYRQHQGQVVCKALYGGNVPIQEGMWDAIYTYIVPQIAIDQEIERVRYQAHQFQSFVDKSYELRVSVVDTQVFAARIDSPEGNTDFRNQYGELQYSVYQLPNALEEVCVKLVKQLGLSYGAIDIMRSKDGEYYFLEINPAGQYQWIEFATGMPITAAIVDRLMKGNA